MKNIYIYLSLLAVIVLGTACNNEWEDEQYEQYVFSKHLSLQEAMVLLLSM